ncbi:lipopolysaccharide biosynthesis protein [Oryzibacter oryziterrae]|uniref:lipopolysaccharide biosynthesis protein n=1 Tax=Oryzibacter oryziterrae TaxID=2766474 RepID=UPI001F1AA340|nr:oligosaccharide flippase family protein [Oryzibacter oryziterrae]
MLIRQTLLYLPAQFLSPVAQFLSMMVWTWWLAPEAMAAFALVTATQELAYMFARSWFSFYTLRFLPLPEDHEGRRRYLGTETTLMLLLALPEIGAAAFGIGFFNGSSDPLTLFGIVALYYVSRGLNNHYAERARAQNAILAYTIFQTCGPLGGLFGGMVVVHYWGASAEHLLLAYGLLQVLGTLVALPMIGFSLHPRRPDMAILKAAFANGGPMLVINCMGWVAENNIRYIVDAIAGAAAFGLLSVGWGIGRRCASVAAMLVAAAAFPLAARMLNAGDRTGAYRQLTINAALLTAVLFPAMVGLALVGDRLVDLAVAEVYREVTKSVLVLAAVGGTVRFYHLHVTDQVLLLERKYFLIGVIDAVEIVATVALSILGFYEAGLPGVVAGSLAGSVLTLAYSSYLAVSGPGFRFPVLDTAKIAFATAVMAFAVRALPVSPTALGLGISIGIGGLTYALTLAIVYFPILKPMMVARFSRHANGLS